MRGPLTLLLPLAPRPLVRRASSRYLAGPTIREAMAVARAANQQECMVTIDVLGEGIDSPAAADAIRDEYLRVLDAVAAAGIWGGVSVKPTALGLPGSEPAALDRIRVIVEHAGRLGRFVRIDMEGSETTDATLRIYERLRDAGHQNTGVVLQARLRRSLDDLRALLRRGRADVRVCKGIYDEPAAIAFKDPELVRRNYIRMCTEILAGGGRLAAATHDERLVYEVQALAEVHDPAHERHELQMLLGVRSDLRDLLVAAGEHVRVYVPYGARGMEYGIRRLRESPEFARSVFRSVLGDLARGRMKRAEPLLTRAGTPGEGGW
jgi:proline dehydrogenase